MNESIPEDPSRSHGGVPERQPLMERIRFLHIPKTAGTTFLDILKRQYKGWGVFPFTGEIPFDIECYRSLDEDRKKKIKVFTGHAPMVTGLEEADQARIITFLRHPVSRVKSFCQHVSEGKSGYLRELFPPERFDLDKFLDSGNDELVNLETKMLINRGACASPDLLNGMTVSEAREMALDNLFNKITVYGLQEYFDESLILFSADLKWKLPFYTSANKKKSNRLLEFKEDHLEKIKALNQIDIQVYEAAKEKFLMILESDKFDRQRFKKLQTYQPFLYPGLKAYNFGKKINALLFRNQG